tara:strand:- start:366 stop:578 length:213 start_codon:yes stop_codon:yes gene_type:complete
VRGVWSASLELIESRNSPLYEFSGRNGEGEDTPPLTFLPKVFLKAEGKSPFMFHLKMFAKDPKNEKGINN